MKGLNICRETRRHRLRRLCGAAAFLCAASSTGALSPNKEISQYIHDQWSEEQGFPRGPVYAVAQTPDGFLWIGTEKGLVRFDGFTFRLFQPADGFPAGPILGLALDGEGALWVRVQGPQFWRFKDGVFRNVLPGLTTPVESDITAMCIGRDGSILFAGIGNGLMRFSQGKLTILVTRAELPRLVISLAETPDEKIWMGTREQGVYYLENGQVHMASGSVPDKKINSLLAAGSNQVWIGTDGGLAKGDARGFARPEGMGLLERLQGLMLLHDRDGNVWMGTRKGVVRINSGGVAHVEDKEHPDEVVTALFEDREGNLWVGSEQGLERFRDSVFTSYSATSGLPSDSSGPVYVDEKGRVWFAPLQGGLYWMKDGRVHAVTVAGLDKDVVYSLSGRKGDLWIGRRQGGLTHLKLSDETPVAESFTEKNGLPQNSVYAVHQSSDGSVWVGTLSGGVARLKNGNVARFTMADGLLSNSILAIQESGDGTMWFGTANGLNAFAANQWKGFTSREGLPPGSVNCSFEDAKGTLWIGTANGLAFLREGKIKTPDDAPAPLREPIFGIREDRAGLLWLVTASHVLRLDREERFDNEPHTAAVREYGLADGLRSTQGVRRHESVVNDSLGRIWLSLSRGLSFVDPRPSNDNFAPALVHVDSVTADGRPIPQRERIRIAEPHQRITLAYIGLSLSVPERVQFRYRLDGFDHGWTDPTSARQAIYTNLDSGWYRFRVIASNGDGVWNSAEASLSFQVVPVFWQTWWFRLAALGLVAGVVLAFIRVRIVALSRELNLRFEERLAERTRIAQELHDTLLQGFVSASMQLHVADERLAGDSPAKPLVGRVLDLMNYVMEEGRNAVRGLRSSKRSSADLQRAFSEVREEFPAPSDMEFHVIVEGAPRALRPMIGEEVYLIGREALSNAFRHSQASRVEMELEYASSHLRVLVRDNGRGIDQEVLRVGREGHWGLSGMKERAERIGAKLRVLSHAAAGTEVELSVPARIAFEGSASGHSGRHGGSASEDTNQHSQGDRVP